MNIADHDRIAVVIAFAEAIMVLRDPYEDGHEKRVSQLAVDLAVEMDMTFDRVESLRYGARLHDVGKIMIAEVILNKTRLNAAEKNMINSHTVMGAAAISALKFDLAIEGIIRHHHENWDGSGYPDKLMGEAIPLGARIVRIVDSFDAMTNVRPYHACFSKTDALLDMEKGSGSSYDPKIFSVFKRMMK